MPDTDAPQSPLGLVCLHCGGTVLRVRHTYYPVPGLKVRYRVCARCGRVNRTQEVVVKIVKRKTP